MIISTNKSVFSNLDTNVSGKLMPANHTTQEFLAFKPVTVCKHYGYLTFDIRGVVVMPSTDLLLDIYLEIGCPGLFSYQIPVIGDISLSQGRTLFSSTVNVPVGPAVDPQNNIAIVTTHFNNHPSYLVEAYCGLLSDPDRVYTAAVSYRYMGNTNAITANSIAIHSVIAEYKEN